MIANTIFAAGAFASLVAAIPMAQPPFPKRDIVWETHTEVALTTIPVTVTHWLEPGETPPTANKQHYGHGHGHGYGHGGYGQQPPAQPETTVSAAAPPPASSPESAPQAPAPSSYEQPASQAAPPPAPTTQAPAPAPTTEQAPPPAYTPEPQPSPQPAPSPSQPSSGGSGSGGGSNGLSGMAAAGKSYTGDLTYYDPGLGACGITSGPDEAIVAISEAIFDSYDTGNPNNNPLCGQSITITGEDGSPYTATIVDRCPGCAQADLDLAPGFFKKVVPTGDGRVPGVSWKFD